MKFVTDKPLPSEYERELLTILIEECAEVQQRATKLLRFGRDEVQPGQDYSNKERLSSEVGDLNTLIELCIKEDLINPETVHYRTERKLEKLRKYMQSSR